MITIAVCDDDLVFLEQFSQMIDGILERQKIEHHIVKFASGKRLLESGSFAIVFLDVEMEGLNGLEAAEQIRRRKDPCCLIFVSSHPRYVFSAFDVEASHYLIKPPDEKKLEEILLRRIQGLKEQEEACCTVKQGNGYCRVPYARICYVEVMGRKIILHTQDDAVMFNGRLEVFGKELPPSFFCCHRSFLVNFAWVCGYEDGEARLTGGEKIPISRRKLPEFKTAFMDYLRREEERECLN